MKNLFFLAAPLLLAGCLHWPGIDNKPPVERVPPPTAAPVAAPALAPSSQGSYSVPVSWSLYPAPAKAIRVWMGTSPTSLSVIAQVPPSVTTSTASGLKKNARYYFQLTAIDTNGLQSAGSAIVSYSQKGSVQAPLAPSMAQ